MAERNVVSAHEVRVFLALKSAGAKWMTARDVAGASNVAERTARAHLLKLVKLHIVDQADVFPGHRYRLAEKAGKRNAAYVLRLQAAVAVFSGE